MRTHPGLAESPGTRDMGGASAAPRRWRQSDGGRGSEPQCGPSSAAAESWTDQRRGRDVGGATRREHELSIQPISERRGEERSAGQGRAGQRDVCFSKI